MAPASEEGVQKLCLCCATTPSAKNSVDGNGLEGKCRCGEGTKRNAEPSDGGGAMYGVERGRETEGRGKSAVK